MSDAPSPIPFSNLAANLRNRARLLDSIAGILDKIPPPDPGDLELVGAAVARSERALHWLLFELAEHAEASEGIPGDQWVDRLQAHVSHEEAEAFLGLARQPMPRPTRRKGA